jgi:hypothetical protein
MRFVRVPVLYALISAGAVLAIPLSSASAQPRDPLGAMDARLRDLEARVAALEGRGNPSTAAAAPATAGVPCQSVSVLAVWATPEAPLTVTVNGAAVGVYDGSISVDLDNFLRPGGNTVGFSYPASPGGSAEAALKCRPPGASNSSTILSMRPAAGRLQAQATVNYTGGR